MEGNTLGAGLRQRESGASTSTEAGSHKCRACTPCSLGLNLRRITGRLSSQLHFGTFCLGCGGSWRKGGKCRTTSMISVGCSGKACDRAAWAHSLLLAAARGRDQAAASLLLDLDTIGHDNLSHEGHALRFRLRPLTCWCPSHDGWRFGEAHEAGCRPFRTNCTGAVALHPRPNSCWQLSLRKWATGSPARGRGTQLNTYQGTQLGFP